MSGHSKWSQIKHQKGIADVKKGQVFGKLGKLISIAAKDGADPASNIKLQNAINQAKIANMPKENIERAIKRASEKDGDLFEITLKALTKNGAGITIDGITDNKNRTLSELKNLISNHEAKVVEWIPDYPMPADDALRELIKDLNDHEDVKEVRTNANLSD